VRRDPGEHELALAQRLPDQPEVQLLEVPQSAVEQLARAGRRAAGEVPRLDQAGAQTARRGVEGSARARDAPAHHEHVQVALAQVAPRSRALGRTQVCSEGRRHHGSSSQVRRPP
jgi:hypothetical protein